MKMRFIAFAFCLLSLAVSIQAQTWNGQTSGVTADLYTVYFINANTGFAAGSSGTLLRTTNGGANWTTVTVPAQFLGAVFRSMRFADANTGYALSGTSVIKTTNGGATWANAGDNTMLSSGLYGLYCVNASTVYAVGLRTSPSILGVIYKTADGGTTWTSQTTSTLVTLNSIHFTDVNTGYAVGSGGTVLKTTNAGTTWTPQTVTTSTWYAVQFTDANTGYIAGQPGSISKTTNAGTSWIAQTSGLTIQFTSMHFPTATTGYVVGPANAGINNIRKTTDGGATWNAETVASGVALFTINGVYCTDASTCYAVGNGGRIIKLGTTVPILTRNRFSTKQSAMAKMFDMRGTRIARPLSELPYGIYAGQFEAGNSQKSLPPNNR